MRRTIVGLGCAVFILLGALAFGALVPRPLLAFGDASANDVRTKILVLSNAIHTDIAIPIDDRARKTFAFLADEGFPLADQNARWLVFGWGGRTFYIETPTWSDLRPIPVLRSFTIDRSVLHVEIAGAFPDQAPGIASLQLTDDGFQSLLNFVSGSFVRQSDRVVPIPGAAYGQFDRFFEARGYFNAFIGCNTWTAAALRAAGLRTGLWNPLPRSLAVSLQLYD